MIGEWLAAFLLAGLLPPTPSPEAVTVVIGKPAPRLVANALDGKAFGENAWHGHALFVNVFATWCAPCRREIPMLVAAYPHYRRRVVFLGIDEKESPNRVAVFVKHMRIPYLIGIDTGELAATYGAGAVPHSLFIDAHGVVRGIWNGPLTRAELERQLMTIAPN
ncbi:MAG: TlpA family protein disulfide reductase [Candidatus Eremiobacteraeota bacterium]|nr:TlpA family protein disulfide reductase [Candidatus Eremiobacteraeota bacterium]